MDQNRNKGVKRANHKNLSLPLGRQAWGWGSTLATKNTSSTSPLSSVTSSLSSWLHPGSLGSDSSCALELQETIPERSLGEILEKAFSRRACTLLASDTKGQDRSILKSRQFWLSAYSFQHRNGNTTLGGCNREICGWFPPTRGFWRPGHTEEDLFLSEAQPHKHPGQKHLSPFFKGLGCEECPTFNVFILQAKPPAFPSIGFCL